MPDSDATAKSGAQNFAAPDGSIFRREIRAVREPFRLLKASRNLLGAPKGHEGVMVVPGYSTNDTVMAALRAYLKSLGHLVWGWDLGTNQGDVAGTLPSVIDQVKRRVRENDDQPIAMVGWSLGGVFAREVARDQPDLITQIITLATPIYGGPRYTVSADDYTEHEIAEIEDTIAERNPRLITQPITAFYSRQDGVVDWRTCLDDLNPDVENIEVDSSHVGITLDPTVWRETATRLAEG